MADLSPRPSLPILHQSQTSLTLFDLKDQNIKQSYNEPNTTSRCSPSISEISTADSYSDSDLDDIPFTELLFKMQRTEEDIMLYKNGYRKLDKICKTLQGELIKAEVTKSSLTNVPIGSLVAIKKTDKKLFEKHIAIQDEIQIIVSEDVVQEASILKKLTAFNSKSDGNSHIVKYIDFFESETHLYLVMEFIDNAITLQEFVSKSFELINNNKLILKQYSKCIKFIMWQLVTTIEYLHDEFHSCHLDICLENIMIRNWKYIKNNSENYLTPNPLIKITLGDFGVAEAFDGSENEKTFLCHKHSLTFDNGCFIAPEIRTYNEYDGRSADIWSYGMVFYQCMVGKPLFIASDMWERPQCGYLALKQNKLRQYLSTQNVLKYFKGCSSLLLKNLLSINQNKRYAAKQIIRHQWFSMYYNKQIKK